MCSVARCRAEIAAIEAQAAGFGHPSRTFGPRAFGRRRLDVWPNPPGIAATSRKARRGSAGRASGGRVLLLRQSIAALTPFRFEALDGEPGLLHRAGHEPADRVTLPAHLVHDLGNRRALGPLKHRNHLGSLAPFARPSGFLRPPGLFSLT